MSELIIKYKSPFGIITIQEKGGAIYRVYLPNQEPNDTSEIVGAGFSRPKPTELLETAKTQFTEYFDGFRKVFDLPLSFDNFGAFHTRVYQELLKIPYGETVSYKQIAIGAGNPKAYRAVGMANNRNPMAIIVPCHRVIGSDGRLVGYAGGTEMKAGLLELEKKIMRNQ